MMLRRTTLIWFAFVACASAAFADQYQYDAQCRIVQVATSGGATVTYTYDDNGNILSIVTSVNPTSVEAEESGGPAFTFSLGQNAPNPGSGPMIVRFSIPARGKVTLRVYDVAGRLVSTPVDATLDPGRYVASLQTSRLAGGVYFYRLQAGGKTLSKKLVLLD